MNRMKDRSGFNLIELLIVLAVLGILVLATYPAVVNVIRVRSLESAARDILMDLGKARVLAVKHKAAVRLIFSQAASGVWTYVLEQHELDGSWAVPGGILPKTIPGDFQVTVNLSDSTVEYSPLGLIQNFTGGMNTITLQSPKLHELEQPDVRSLILYAGGAVQYLKSSST